MQTVLVTGANRGLGLEFVRQFAADGWQVLAACRAPDRATELAARAASSDCIRIFALDVSRPEQFSALAQKLRGQPLDILLHNAGLRGPVNERFGEGNATAWLDVLKVNTVAPRLLSEALCENLLRGRRKLVAMITSKMGSIALNAQGGDYAYRSSKAALNAVAKSMAVDLKSQGITVVTVHPGWVRTAMGAPEAPLSPEQSVAAVRQLLARIRPGDTGKFFNYDGTELPW